MFDYKVCVPQKQSSHGLSGGSTEWKYHSVVIRYFEVVIERFARADAGTFLQTFGVSGAVAEPCGPTLKQAA